MKVPAGIKRNFIPIEFVKSDSRPFVRCNEDKASLISEEPKGNLRRDETGLTDDGSSFESEP